MRKLGLFVFGALWAMAAQAQTINGLVVEPAQAKVGEAVKITASFDPAESANCGLRIHFGDGTTEKRKIQKASDMPVVLTRSYAQPGQYKVEAEPTTAGMTLKCLGKRQSTMLTVVAATAPAVAATSGTAKPSLCPEGWTLSKPGQNAKNKSFTCKAKAGTAVPTAKIACPGDLTYFENSKKGLLGCRL